MVPVNLCDILFIEGKGAYLHVIKVGNVRIPVGKSYLKEFYQRLQ